MEIDGAVLNQLNFIFRSFWKCWFIINMKQGGRSSVSSRLFQLPSILIDGCDMINATAALHNRICIPSVFSGHWHAWNCPNIAYVIIFRVDRVFVFTTVFDYFRMLSKFECPFFGSSKRKKKTQNRSKLIKVVWNKINRWVCWSKLELLWSLG